MTAVVNLAAWIGEDPRHLIAWVGMSLVIIGVIIHPKGTRRG